MQSCKTPHEIYRVCTFTDMMYRDDKQNVVVVNMSIDMYVCIMIKNELEAL